MMLRAVFLFALSVTLVMGLRRSVSEGAAGTATLTALLKSKSSSFSTTHLDSILDLLHTSKGSNLSSALQDVVADLKVSRGKVLAAVAITSQEIDANLIAWDRDTTQSVVDYHDAVEIDKKWSACIGREQNKSRVLAGKVARRAQVLKNRNRAEAKATDLSPIDESMSFPKFACDSSATNCLAKWTEWEKAAEDAIGHLDDQVTANIAKYQEANATWTNKIEIYNNVTEAVRQQQSRWLKNNETCDRNKAKRQRERCVYTRAQRSQCAAKGKLDKLLAQVAGADNPFSHGDQKLEYKSLNLAICVLETFDQDGTLSDDIEASCAISHGIELQEAPDLQSSKYDLVEAKADYACGTESFTFGGDQWTESRFLPQAKDEEDVWVAHPNSDDYVLTTGYTWSENELAAECP